MKRFRLLTLLLLATAASQAFALDFKYLADNAIVYDAGSNKAQPLFILRKGTPVETIVSVDKWVKVREQSGGIGWVERSQVSDTAQVLVVADSVSVRATPDEHGAVVFSAARSVLLEPLEKPSGAWLKVKHRDGASGYVPLKSVWGI